eukprot:Lithocolla_globosa_v1_NODE_576_length_3702_cov_18.492185.p4 type:complete len:137 gc:universal NODE_576_length_3702_cov_18.492185:2344-2754(+)
MSSDLRSASDLTPRTKTKSTCSLSRKLRWICGEGNMQGFNSSSTSTVFGGAQRCGFRDTMFPMPFTSLFFKIECSDWLILANQRRKSSFRPIKNHLPRPKRQDGREKRLCVWWVGNGTARLCRQRNPFPSCSFRRF